MATPFQDFLRDREYTGRPLVVSNQFPPPEGTDFVEVVEAKKEPGMGTVHRGRLLMQNDQGVPTWTWVKLLRPKYFSTGFVLAHYGAQLKGGARMLVYCQIPGREFLAIEAKGGMDLPFFLQYRADVGRHPGDEAERLESISYEMVRQVLTNNEGGVFHMDLGLDSVIVDNYADDDTKTYGAGDVHLVGYQRRGMVSSKFRDEAMGVQPSRGRREMCSTLPGPNAVLHAAKDVFLGRHMTADERVFANEILVERYHLAGTVFRIFGGNDVDSPQPPSMPDDLFNLLAGLSASDFSKRFHPYAKLKKHPWMKRRAAIAAAVSKGGNYTDQKFTHGETRRAFLKPQAKQTATSTRNDGGAVDPSNVSVQTVRGTGGEGAAAAAEAEAVAMAASVGPAVKVLEVPPGSPPVSGSGSGSGSSSGSGSGSGVWWGSGPKSTLLVASQSGTSPGSSRGSWADSGDRNKYCDGGSGLSSRSADTVNPMGDCKSKGSSRDKGTVKGKKDAGVRAEEGTRITPTRSTTAAAGLLASSSSSGSGSVSGPNVWWGSGKEPVSQSGSGSSLILPRVSESEPGSVSSSGSGSGVWWGSGPKSVSPTVSESGTSPGSIRDSSADSGDNTKCCEEGSGLSSRSADTVNPMGDCKSKGSSRGKGTVKGKKDAGVRAEEGTRITPTRSTTAPAGLLASSSRSGSSSVSGPNVWWGSVKEAQSALPIDSESGSGSSLTLPTVSESEPGWGSSSHSKSRSLCDSGPKSILLTVAELRASPGSRRESRADYGKSQTGTTDGDDRSSRPTDMDEDVDTQGCKVKGSGEGTGKGEENTKKGGQRRASRGKRVMPMRPTAAAAGLPDPREASAGAANTHGVIVYKRKRLKSDAGSDGPVEKPRKRYQTSPRGDGGGFSRPPLAVPVAVAHTSRGVPQGSPLARAFIGSNAVDVCSPSGCCSIAEPEYDGLEGCCGGKPGGIDNAGSHPDAGGNKGSSRGRVASSMAGAAALAGRVSSDIASFGASFFSLRKR